MSTADLARRERWALAVAGRDRPGLASRWARRTLQASPRGRAAYDALARAEQVASGRDVTRTQSAHLEASLFAALDGEGQASGGRGGATGRLAVAGAAVCAVAFLVWSPPAGDDLGELSVRGLGDGTLGVTVRCLARGAPPEIVGQVAAGPRRSSGALSCAADGLLSFSFTNTTDDDLFVMIVGVSEDDQLRWYAPFSADGSSARLPAGNVDVPMPVAADLAPMPSGERVTLRALFSRRAVRASTVGALVDQARARRLSPSRIDRLPLDGTLEARVELRVLADGAARP